MLTADRIVDMGPGPGEHGGRVVFEGTPAALVKAKSTLTGQHLAKFVAGDGRPEQCVEAILVRQAAGAACPRWAWDQAWRQPWGRSAS